MDDQPDLFEYSEQQDRLPPTRYGPGRAIHPEVRRQREAFIEEAIQRGDTLTKIAATAGVRPETVRRWRDRTSSTKFEGKFDKERKCLTCQELFWSEGAHNRMCTDCRFKKSHNPYEPGAHGNSGKQRSRL